MALLIAAVEGGTVKGLPAGNQAISVFKGVPYAAPPVGELRWRAPQPVVPWDGELEAYAFSCVNMHERTPAKSFYGKEFRPVELPMSEDCLYLNIWTPANSIEDKCAVAVWFHGGNAYGPKIEFDGEGFGKRGVILVTVGFRTDVFGNLAHPELSKESERETGHYTSGNYRTLDQIAAIKWVKRNIKAFGGDPDRITAFGQSAGSLATQKVTSSPLTEGYITRAIMQSTGGVGVLHRGNVGQTLEYAEKMGVKLLSELGIKDIKAARQTDAFELLRLIKEKASPETNSATKRDNVDHYVFNRSAVETAMHDEHHRIQYIVGTTKDEKNSKAVANYPDHPDIEAFKANARKTFGEYADEYLKLADAETEEGVLRTMMENMQDDNMAAALGWCEVQNRLGRIPSYQYFFTKEAPGGDGAGAFHSAEHAYVFQTLLRIWRPYDGSDFELSNTMCDYWCNYIKTGDPNGEAFTGGKLPRWEPNVDAANDPWVMEFGCHIGMITPPQTRITKFLRKFTMSFMK